jgi:hypothetical protein
MSRSIQVVFGILFALGYLVAPIMLIWGWARWMAQPKPRTAASILSLIGFILATASAVLAIVSVIYAHVIHGFPFYDPLLLRIFRWGLLLSGAGFVFGISGVWGRSSLRWHAPACAVGTVAFWMPAACFCTESPSTGYRLIVRPVTDFVRGLSYSETQFVLLVNVHAGLTTLHHN